MRMSRHLGIYTSVSVPVPVAVYGAPSEMVTITDGTATYTSETDTHGIGVSVDLRPGVYTIIGTVSSELLASGRSVTVDETTAVITAYPPTAIFWFGNGDAAGDSLYSVSGGFENDNDMRPNGASVNRIYTCSVVQEAHRMDLQMAKSAQNSSYLYSAGFHMVNAIDTVGKTYIKVYVDASSGTAYAANALQYNFESAGSVSMATAGEKSMNIGPYFATWTSISEELGGITRHIYIKAIWTD